jgi:hypothetical protein
MKKLSPILIFLISVSVLNGTADKKTFNSAQDWDKTLYDWKIDVTTSPGEVKLLKTELITDETGVTTGNMEEIIKGKTWIKKEFLLDRVEADRAVLLIHWNEFSLNEFKNQDAYLWVDVNEHPIKLSVDVKRMLTGGWIRCDVPVEYLHPGLNTVILHNDTDYEFIISVEASKIPNRSAKSIDGGKTWDYNHLGRGNFIDGEYLIRLRLARYPGKAEIKSDFIELASTVTDNLIKPEIRLNKIDISIESETPAGTSLFLQVRGGSTPAYHPDTWSHWQTLPELTHEILENWEFFQWRIEIETDNHRVTPVIKGLTISPDIDVISTPREGITVEQDDNQTIIRGYYHYTYQDSEEYRLKVLRDRYRLEEVIGGCSTEFQKYRTLALWVKGQWRDGWGEHGKELHTPWDALISLELAPQYKASGMCTIYSNTFIQTALAVGLQARGMVLDHHFISEVWSNELNKWVMFDIGNTSNSLRSSYYEKDGTPLNSLEIHTLANAGKMDEIWVVPVGVHDKFRGTEDKKEEVLGPRQWKPRFGIPLRNNYLNSWLPGELEHGFIQYHYDGYLWWKDDPMPKYEEYTYHSSHERDFYWTINQAQIILKAAGKPDELSVVLDTVTPNFKEFQVRINSKEWKPSSGAFIWKLHEGLNTIEARPVNKFEKAGIISKIQLIR